MKTEIAEFLRETDKTTTVNYGYTERKLQVTRPRVVCNDGFSVSVQAGLYGAYYDEVSVIHGLDLGFVCYRSVELGYPSVDDPIIHDYMEDLSSDVYPYVPVEIVEQLIQKHGGINWDKTLRKSV